MCRILAVKNFKFEDHKDILADFLKLAETGKVPPNNQPGHLDGWGVGYYQFGSAVTVKSGGSAVKERDRILSALKEAKNSEVLIVHLRKSAWPESATKRHAHPFEYKNRLFAHNGTVLDYQKMMIELPAAAKPGQDSLDTEVFFRLITMDEAADLSDVYKKTVSDVRQNNDFTSLTSVLTDGVKLLACRCHADFHPDYYTLFSAAGQSAASRVLCSEKLPSLQGWEEIKNGEFVNY
jgi:predicted glutamine amidotransferase